MKNMSLGAVMHDKRGRIVDNPDPKKISKRILSKPLKKGDVRLTQPKNKEPKQKADEWSEFDKLGDKQIEQAVAKDPDAALILDDSFWDKAKVVFPVPKQAISIRIDEDVLAFFKKMGPGYQSRMNAVLRSYMEAKK